MIRFGVRRCHALVPAASLVFSVSSRPLSLPTDKSNSTYLFATDQKGRRVSSTSDIAIKEDVGPSSILSVRRFAGCSKSLCSSTTARAPSMRSCTTARA